MIPLPAGLSLKLVIGIAAVMMVALLVNDRNRWKAKTAHYSEILAAERGAHSATVAGYRAAAAKARAADAANAARVKAGQAAINERTANDYQSRIAAARALGERLRRKAGSDADPGAGGGAAMPGLSASAQGVAEGAGKDRLPDADKRAGSPEGQLGAGDALIATEQAIQLDELIKWVRDQAAVPQQ